MATRRDVLAALGGAAVSFTGIALAGRARAASPIVVEVLAMAHWPVQRALKPVRDILAKYDGQVKVVDMDIESPDGVKRAKSVGLKGHIPVIILINGNKSFKRADGKTVEFVNFPAAANNPMGLNGAWSMSDFETAVRAAVDQSAG